MKTIKVFGYQQTALNQFTFTRQELEKLLNKVYSEGYEEGYLSLTNNATHTHQIGEQRVSLIQIN